MSLVNPDTGELIAQCTPDEARALTDKIKVAVEATWQLVATAYERRAWAALGFASWDDYCTREFGTSRLRLPREERQEVVASLRESGLSLRAIAAVTGEHFSTVSRELAGVANATPGGAKPVETRFKESMKVTGTDGKTYRASHVNAGKLSMDDPKRLAKLRDGAARGMDRDQLAADLGLDRRYLARIITRHSIAIPADVASNVRRIDSNRLVGEGVMTIDGAVSGLRLAVIGDLDPDQVEGWIASLTDSLSFLNKFRKQMKETIQ